LHPRAAVGLDPDHHLRRVLVGIEVIGDQRVQPGRPGHPFGQPPRRQPVSRGVHDLDVVMIFCPVITDEHHRGPLLLPLPPAMP
jgi:hypothetical protein